MIHVQAIVSAAAFLWKLRNEANEDDPDGSAARSLMSEAWNHLDFGHRRSFEWARREGYQDATRSLGSLGRSMARWGLSDGRLSSTSRPRRALPRYSRARRKRAPLQ